MHQTFWCIGLDQRAKENYANKSLCLFEAARNQQASTMLTMAMKRSSVLQTVVGGIQRAYASLAVGSDIVSAAPHVSLQKARSWDEGVSSKFATTPLRDIFKGKKVVMFGLPGAYTGVCSAQHVPSYKNNIDKFKAKGVDSVICVAINDPYVMNGWAEKLEAKHALSFWRMQSD